jgi:predicted permease
MFWLLNGTFFTAYYSINSNISSRIIIQKIVTYPSFLSLIVALMFLGQTVTNILTTFANTLIPVALIAVGLRLQFKLPKDDMKPLSIAFITTFVISKLLI